MHKAVMPSYRQYPNRRVFTESHLQMSESKMNLQNLFALKYRHGTRLININTEQFLAKNKYAIRTQCP